MMFCWEHLYGAWRSRPDELRMSGKGDLVKPGCKTPDLKEG